MKFYGTGCSICLLLIVLEQAWSEKAGMDKTELREEDLLPVRMIRSTLEGSGDGESIPIVPLSSGVMERMTLGEGESAIADDTRPKESTEDSDEGSGFDEGKLMVKSEEVTETTTYASTVLVDLTETSIPEATESERSTADQSQKTATAEAVTEMRPEVTTGSLPPETTAVTEAHSDVSTELKTITALPDADFTQPQTTLASTTAEPVTEVIQVVYVKPVLAVEVTTKETTEAATTTTTTTTTTTIPPDNTPTVANETLLSNENLTGGTDTLLMKANSRLLDSDESVLLSSKDTSRIGTYIVVSLILLSFLSLIGFVLMKRRVQKRRKQSKIDHDALDTEKALLSLSEYKDHPDGVDEGKIRNNEITPIVIKSNSQINRFEKNTNFSSPKNLNTKANEKNVEKDNVLKKNSEHLTHAIIEDASKDADEGKAPTNAEKLIVRTHLDQDSIPKKPVIVNRTSLSSSPLAQD